VGEGKKRESGDEGGKQKQIQLGGWKGVSEGERAEEREGELDK
jgi:hypothetical protein